MTDVLSNWAQHYSGVEKNLQNMRKINAVATAFNTNIDAVLKIDGKKLAELAGQLDLTWDELNNPDEYYLRTPADFVKGSLRCFKNGIAEEWLSNREVYDWMVENIGFNRLQMGGQGGIVANAMAVCGVKKVYNHCSSLPKQQAELFLDLDNLLSFDEKGEVQKAHQINREQDVPMIHWIIEFDKGDAFVYGEHRVVCPKANRFIATYDPLNSCLAMDENYVAYLNQNPVEAVVLSGFHPLTQANGGIDLVKNALPIIQRWQEKGALIHLEVASTQDIGVRKTIIDFIAAQADSIGLNERETIDVLQVIDEQDLAKLCEENCLAVNLFEAILSIKKKVGCKRIQLHMFGLYLTIQDADFVLTPQQNRSGMCLAAVAAAGKAGTGNLNCYENLLWAKGKAVCQEGLKSLSAIADYIGDKNFINEGIARYEGFDVVAVPTILVEKPITLVGMGDTISSVSLIGAMAAKA